MLNKIDHFIRVIKKTPNNIKNNNTNNENNSERRVSGRRQRLTGVPTSPYAMQEIAEVNVACRL